MLLIRYKFLRIEHNTVHTLFQFITLTRLTLVDDNKMTQCQIFTAQTALVRHLLSEMRISYLYTW